MYSHTYGYWALPNPYYPPPPPYYYPPPQQAQPAPHPSPRNLKRAYETQRVELNPFIDSTHRGTPHFAVWDVRTGVQGVTRYIENGRARAPFAPAQFAQTATRVPVNRMNIFLSELQYDFEIHGGNDRAVTLGDVFKGITRALYAEYGEDDWEVLGEEEQKMIHDERCGRLHQEPPSYVLEPMTTVVRKIDTLYDRTMFGGLKPMGHPEELMWELKLLKPKPHKERRRH